MGRSIQEDHAKEGAPTESSADASAARVEELIDTGDFDGAADALGACPPDAMTVARRHILDGRIAAGREDFKAALRSFDEALALTPTDPEAIVGRAFTLFDLGRRRRARLLIWRSARSRRDEPAVVRARGTLQILAKQPRRAAKTLTRAAALAPDDLSVLDQLLSLLSDLGRFDDARRELAGALARFPDDARPRLWLGIIELTDHHLEAAADCFSLARGDGVERAFVVALHAGTLRRLGRLAAARAQIEEEIGDVEESTSAGLLVQLSNIRFDEGLLEEAEALSRRALEVDPGNEAAAMNVADLLIRQGRREDALRCLRDSAEHAPESQDLLMAIADIARDLHDYAGAATSHKQALELRPGGKARKRWLHIRWRSRRIPLVAGFLPSIDRDGRRRFDEQRPVLALLDDLLSSSGTPRGSLRARAARLAWRRARSGALLAGVAGPAFAAVGVVTGLAVWASPLIIDGTDGTEPLAEYAVFGGVYLLALALGWALWAWTISLDRRSSFLARVALLAFAPATAVVGLLSARDHAPDAIVLPLLWAAGAFAVMFTLQFIVTLGLTGAEGLAERRARRGDPYAAAVIALLTVLHALRTGVDPIDRSDVRPIVSALEEAAAGLEDHLRGLQPTGDIRSDAWLTERAGGIAAAVRELKAWVLSPGPETFSALATRIEADVTSISQGSWRNLPWSDPVAAAATARRLRLMALARNLAFAILPLAGTLVAQSAGVVEGATANQFLLGSSVWGAVALIVTLDPTFADKLAAFREARGALKQGPSGTAGPPA